MNCHFLPKFRGLTSTTGEQVGGEEKADRTAAVGPRSGGNRRRKVDVGGGGLTAKAASLPSRNPMMTASDRSRSDGSPRRQIGGRQRK